MRFSQLPLGWRIFTLTLYIAAMFGYWLFLRWFFHDLLPHAWTVGIGWIAISYSVIYYSWPLLRWLHLLPGEDRRRRRTAR